MMPWTVFVKSNVFGVLNQFIRIFIEHQTTTNCTVVSGSKLLVLFTGSLTPRLANPITQCETNSLTSEEFKVSENSVNSEK